VSPALFAAIAAQAAPATPLPLDAVAGARAAYGLVRLGSGVTGAVARLRRGSDNVEADFTAPEFVDGTVAAWASGTAYVKTLYDQTGGSTHMTQATTGSQPVVAWVSGVPVIRTASSQYLAGALSSVSARALYALAQLPANPGGTGRPIGVTSQGAWQTDTNTVWRWRSASTTTIGGSLTIPTALCASADAGASTRDVRVVQTGYDSGVATPSGTGTFTDTGLGIGALYAGGNPQSSDVWAVVDYAARHAAPEFALMVPALRALSG
jgi:hypothetical protein